MSWQTLDVNATLRSDLSAGLTFATLTLVARVNPATLILVISDDLQLLSGRKNRQGPHCV